MKEGSESTLVRMHINGEAVEVPRGMVVASAIARAGIMRLRRSVSGELRGPVCGMGVCMECEVTINGERHCRSCQRSCEDGMQVETDE